MKKQMSYRGENPIRGRDSKAGFTLFELIIVVVVVILLASITVPQFLTFIHYSRLQGAGSEFSGLLQQARIRAVQDDGVYSTYFITTGTVKEAYVDLKANGGSSVDTGDPLIEISNEVSTVAASSAPDTDNLKGQFLPTGSTLTINDGSSSSSPVNFNSRGLPCTSLSVTGGSICSSSSTYVTAFWVFFQNSYTQAWLAVTISPAGRIQKWRHDASSWSKM
jgi:Tfp pilus assembly protein FimT